MNVQKAKSEKKTKAQKLAAGLALPKGNASAPAISTDAAKAFEAMGNGAVPAPPRSAGRMRRKTSVTEMERVNTYVPIALMTKVREHCARERLSLSAFVTEAMAGALSSGHGTAGK